MPPLPINGIWNRSVGRLQIPWIDSNKQTRLRRVLLIKVYFTIDKLHDCLSKIPYRIGSNALWKVRIFSRITQYSLVKKKITHLILCPAGMYMQNRQKYGTDITLTSYRREKKKNINIPSREKKTKQKNKTNN